MSQINVERNFNPGKNNKRQTNRKRFKYVPLNTTEYTEPTENFTKFFTVKFEEEHKRTVNPYAIRNEIVRITGMKPKRIHSFDKTSFTIEAQNKTQSPCLTQINIVEEKTCTTTPHMYYNQSKGIIYIQEYDVTDIVEFENGLKSEYDIAEVIKAYFIKAKNEHTTPLLITFNSESLPETLYIPGEKSDTIIYPFKNRPMICRKCYQYMHTVKYC